MIQKWESNVHPVHYYRYFFIFFLLFFSGSFLFGSPMNGFEINEEIIKWDRDSNQYMWLAIRSKSWQYLKSDHYRNENKKKTKNREQNRWTSSKEKQKMICSKRKNRKCIQKDTGQNSECAIFDWITFLFQVVSFHPHPHTHTLNLFLFSCLLLIFHSNLLDSMLRLAYKQYENFFCAAAIVIVVVVFWSLYELFVFIEMNLCDEIEKLFHRLMRDFLKSLKWISVNCFTLW